MPIYAVVRVSEGRRDRDRGREIMEFHESNERMRTLSRTSSWTTAAQD